MPVRYSTNWMGPVSLKWYEDRGLTERYSAGRIDIRGQDGGGEWIDREYGLSPMKSQDWEDLSKWLDTVETDFVWNKEDLLTNFERFIGRPIAWSKE